MFLEFQSKLDGLKIEQNEYVTKNSFQFELYNAFSGNSPLFHF